MLERNLLCRDDISDILAFQNFNRSIRQMLNQDGGIMFPKYTQFYSNTHKLHTAACRCTCDLPYIQTAYAFSVVEMQQITFSFLSWQK